MYNLELMNNEEVIRIFDEIFVKQNKNEKITTIVLTNKRLLFLDYLIENEGLEVLRIARGINYIKTKEVYYQINLSDVKNISKNKYHKIVCKNGMSFEFDDDELYKLLKC